MRWCSKLVLIFVLFLVYITIYYNFHKGLDSSREVTRLFSAKWKRFNIETVNICVVACGESRVEEVLVLIKSALVFSTKEFHLNFLIVTEKSLFQLLTEKIEAFQNFHDFSFLLRETKFPNDRGEMWRTLFKPCAAQRLFLPSLLPDIDELIYLDSDTLFLSSPLEIYEKFKQFNSTQIAGLVQEAENKNTGWYSRFAQHEYYGLGLNSGVMLMNLKRMRQINWEKSLVPIYEKYNLRIVFGDQDLINIYFNFNPGQLYLMPCEYNYRPDHCMYTSLCHAPDGLKIIHGNRASFHKSGQIGQPIFSQIYDTMLKVKNIFNY